MSLVSLGRRVALIMADGSLSKPRSQAAILYDPSGMYWPRCSVLVCSFVRNGTTMKLDGFTKDWFGRDYDLREGSANLPPRDLARWREVGAVAKILYTRGSGDRRPAKAAGDYEHQFGGKSIFDIFTFTRPELPILYRYGAALRLELGKRCHVTGRGFVAP